MEYLSDTSMLESMLKKWQIPAHFDTAGLRFQLVKYHKGELLVTPFEPMEQLLFLLRGKVMIYGLREDGSSFSVYLAGQSVLLGDVEFIRKESLPFYTEAMEDVLCVSLPVERYRKKLERDVQFLNFILRSVADKFHMFFQIGNPAQPVKERLVAFLRDMQPDHTLHGMNVGVMQLHCSRSQLQRVLKRLCGEGVLIKEKKGKYRLV